MVLNLKSKNYCETKYEPLAKPHFKIMQNSQHIVIRFLGKKCTTLKLNSQKFFKLNKFLILVIANGQFEFK